MPRIHPSSPSYLFAALLLLVSGASALGQNNRDLQYAPKRRVNGARDQAVLYNQRAPSNRAFRYGGGYGPGYGYGYNPYVYRSTPMEGYLNGVANVTQANGEYQQQIQGAKLDRERAKQEAIRTRKMQFDQRQYELANTPTLQDRLDWKRKMNEREARDNATAVMITSGRTLNILLDHSMKLQNQGLYGPKIPLDPAILKDINIASPTTGGNAGLLKDGGKLEWPLPLLDDAYNKDRNKLDKLLKDAVAQAERYGKVERKTQYDLIQTRNHLDNQVISRVKDITPTEYIQSRRYLRELKENLKVLDDPNLGNYFTKKWTPQGDTVAELINNMSQKGLKFAEAARGSEASYMALYNAMRAYDVALYGLAKGPSR